MKIANFALLRSRSDNGGRFLRAATLAMLGAFGSLASNASAATITVNFQIYAQGTVKSIVNNVPLNNYLVEISAPDSFSAEYTSQSDGFYGNQPLVRIHGSIVAERYASTAGFQKLDFSIPVKITVRRDWAQTTFAYEQIVDVPFTDTFQMSETGPLNITKTITANLLVNPPAYEVPLLTLTPTKTGVDATWAVPTETFSPPETTDVWIAVSTASNPTAGCNNATAAIRVPRTTTTLKIVGFGSALHRVRACALSRYGTVSSGRLANATPLPSIFDDLRAEISAYNLRIHANGLYYNDDGLKERWLAGTQFWAYLTPDGKLRRAVNGNSNIATDQVLVDYTQAIRTTPMPVMHSLPYDHPSLIVAVPPETAGQLQFRQLDEDLSLTPSTIAGYDLNRYGLSDKSIIGATANNKYIILPTGQINSCVFAAGQFTCTTPFAVVPPSTYVNPLTLALRHENFLDSRYGFYLDSGSDYYNWAGKGERWFRSNNITQPLKPWYYMLPDGRIFRWDSNAQLSVGTAADNLVSRVPVAVHSNLTNMLLNAAP